MPDRFVSPLFLFRLEVRMPSPVTGVVVWVRELGET